MGYGGDQFQRDEAARRQHAEAAVSWPDQCQQQQERERKLGDADNASEPFRQMHGPCGVAHQFLARGEDLVPAHEPVKCRK